MSDTSADKTAAPATAAEKVVDAVKKYIPGLSREQPAASKPAAAKRSRSSKGKKGAVAAADDPALATASLSQAPDAADLPDSLVVPAGAGAGAATTAGSGAASKPAGLNGDLGLSSEEIAELQHKRFSPALTVQKRLRANNKKLQRIAAYEQETGVLNADQQKALATKPALELVQKDLTELIKALELEEAEEDKRIAKKQQYEEKQVQARINAAVANSKVHTQNDLTLLLQFLHLYSLFNPSQSFAPPTLPSVVANATGQQHAAVHTLFNSLANGPLFGGAAADSGDAISQIQALQQGTDKPVIEGVTFADVKQMILDLTAPPAEVGHEIPEDTAAPHAAAESATGLPSVQEPPLAAATTETGEPSLNFMQASELGQPSKSADTSAGNTSIEDAPEHQRALESVSAAATPGFGSGTPVLEHPQQQQQPSGWKEPTGLVSGSVSADTNGWGEDTASAPIKSWADEVDDTHPSNPFTATPDVPAEVAGQDSSDTIPVGGEAIESSGVTADGRGRGRGRGGRGGRGRGEFRGRGRGGFRGGEGSSGEWRNRSTDAAAPDSAVKGALSAAGDGFTDVRGRSHRGTSGGFRGRGRGEGGEFRGRGRGRGGPRTGSGPNAPSAPAAAAAGDA